MARLNLGTATCNCTKTHSSPALVVLTGGPGAGKTAVLEMARRMVCRHVAILPEAATVVFGGGFPREPDLGSRRAIQRAIFHVQREMERLAATHPDIAVVLLDRGTIDGLAYWPNHEEELFADVGTTLDEQLARYHAVVHLEVPEPHEGYNNDANPLRTEDVEEARAIDARIGTVWAKHPRRVFVDAHVDFVEKAKTALAEVARVLPSCCQIVGRV